MTSPRKSAPRKSAPQKSAPRKSAPRESAPRKSAAKQAGSSGSRADGGRMSPAALARQLSQELAELIGREPEGVISLERTDDGWRVGIEVLELHRVPDTADVLAEYEVEADSGGQLSSYRRVARYARGRTRDD